MFAAGLIRNATASMAARVPGFHGQLSRMGSAVLALTLIGLLAGCQSVERRLALAELEKTVMRTEKMIVEDSASRAPQDCQQQPSSWRAPIQSLSQDIRIQRCDVVYYYLARYSMVGGDVLSVSFVPSFSYLGREDLTTGEQFDAD